MSSIVLTISDQINDYFAHFLQLLINFEILLVEGGFHFSTNILIFQ